MALQLYFYTFIKQSRALGIISTLRRKRRKVFVNMISALVNTNVARARGNLDTKLRCIEFAKINLQQSKKYI